MLHCSTHSPDATNNNTEQENTSIGVLYTKRGGMVAKIQSSNFEKSSMLDESTGRRECNAVEIKGFR